ncbi:MAG: sodium/solute symporter, partial [Calditrichaeota bacterium]|nr:sodium/solute symporter [Calditrichota bacterium]
MTPFDWTIVGAYLLGMILLSVFLGKDQTSKDDYYVGGRSLSWWAIGISTMATQTSAISFISKPAFVALKPGGGLTWLQFELALPLAVIVLMAVMVPFFRRLELVSVYEYLEMRFNAATRYLVSAVFLVSRGLAAGVIIYTTAIMMSVSLETPLWLMIILIGVVTIIYDTIGGMKAVVYSDVIQMVMLLGGIALCIALAIEEVGSVWKIFEILPAERLRAIDPGTGLGDGSTTPFWGVLIGGFFLYISYYGTDQSQVQRGLSTDTIESTKKSLFFNGLARFPLTALYMLLGIAVFAVYQQSPDLQALVTVDNPDYLVPHYIIAHVPTGLKAVLIAAILAAAMSSVDSTLNSLSAVTMQDFVPDALSSGERSLFIGKVVTVIWGVLITAFAFLAPLIQGTIIEVVNKIGSAFYGPIAAAFLVGILSKRANATGIFWGISVGVAVNVSLWLAGLWLGHEIIYWMWWNMLGTVLTAGITLLMSYTAPAPSPEQLSAYTLSLADIRQSEKGWGKYYL